MNGAESLIRTLGGWECNDVFFKSRHSEIHIVGALDRIPEMRCVLGLFEGVVTGAADGYARMAERPACTLLHLGPGLGNGLAICIMPVGHRCQSSISLASTLPITCVHDTPLTSDIEAIARPCSKWLRTSTTASRVGTTRLTQSSQRVLLPVRSLRSSFLRM